MRFLREIVGHKPIVQILLNAVARGRVAHAYLFAGPGGVGKETTAFAFARALLCSEPSRGDACGACRACRQVEHRNHPDLQRVEPSGASLKIDQVRAIQRSAPFRSYQGGRKIFLICKAELMTVEAANCLLKTLEEPPENTVFILLSDRPQILLPTVLSRCQQIVFKGLPAAELARGPVNLHGVEEGESFHPAAWSGGSMDRALEVVSGTFREERDAALELAKAVGCAAPLEALELAGKISEDRTKAHDLLRLLSLWYRDLLVFKLTGDESLLFYPDQAAAVIREVDSFETRRLVEILESIDSVKQKIESNANIRLGLEALFLRLAGRVPPAGGAFRPGR